MRTPQAVMGKIAWFPTRTKRGTYAVRLLSDAAASLGLSLGDRVMVEFRGWTAVGVIDVMSETMVARVVVDRALVVNCGCNVRVRRARGAA